MTVGYVVLLAGILFNARFNDYPPTVFEWIIRTDAAFVLPFVPLNGLFCFTLHPYAVINVHRIGRNDRKSVCGCPTAAWPAIHD